MAKPFNRMKSKINLRLVLVALLSVVATAVLVMVIYHNAAREHMQEDTRAYAAMLAQSYEKLTDKESVCRFGDDTFRRITLVSPSGEVLADNRADPAAMNSHRDRPEVAEALEKGTGEIERFSDTLENEQYYYALRLSDGHVLRVAGQVDSLFVSVQGMLPAILGVLAVLVVLSMVLSRLLTRQLVEPIEAMAEDMDHIAQRVPYDELRPFAAAMEERQKKKSEIEKMRQEFTANVSHELKTPLTSISGYAEMMESGMVQPADMPVFAGKIRKESGRLVSLIGDILQLSALDAQASPDSAEPVCLRELAEECVRRLAFKAEQEQITLSVEGDAGGITGHRQSLEQLIYNLCDNAIRYNRPGGKVTLRLTAGADGVELAVIDTGIGIPPEHLERIFERFYRVDKSRSKETGGTGLGLAIVKHIALQHGAELAVDSILGEGTTVFVRFKTDIAE